MAIVVENGWAREDFSISSDDKTFVSSINLPEDEYNALTEEQREAIKQKMFDDWLIAAAPQPSTEPFDELAWLASLNAESQD